MAATGKTPILLYGSTTPTNAPTAGNLTNSSDGCEIAINVADKNLFFKDSTNAVNTVPIRQSSASSNGWLSSTDWTTFNSKAPAVTYTTNYVPYGQGTTSLNQSASLQFDSRMFSIVGPSGTWDAAFTGIQTAGGSFTTLSNDQYLMVNSYYKSGSGFTYIASKPASYLNFNNTANGDLIWATAASGTAGAAASFTERMRWFNSGGVSIGNTTDPGAGNLRLESSSAGKQFTIRNTAATAGQLWTYGPNSANSLIIVNQDGNGVYMANGGTSWTSLSDERLKTDLVPIEDASNKVSTLRAVTGRYIKDDTSVSRAFLIAQDVQKVLPEAVNVQPDEQGTLGIQYTDVIPLLVAAIKEQKTMIDQLNQRLSNANIF